jgi:hypothetical protein
MPNIIAKWWLIQSGVNNKIDSMINMDYFPWICITAWNYKVVDRNRVTSR